MGSLYTGRAFVPVDKGGQPPDFPLGIMQFPAMDGGACNECKTLAIGASFAINAASKHQDLAARILNAMATPEMGKHWLETIYLQTAVKTGDVAFSGPYAAYFTELMAAPAGRQILHRHAGRSSCRAVQGHLHPGDELRRSPAA